MHHALQSQKQDTHCPLAQHLPNFPPEHGKTSSADDVCVHNITPTPCHVPLPPPFFIRDPSNRSRSPSVRSRRSSTRSPERFYCDAPHYSTPSYTITEEVGAQPPTKVPGRVFESWFKVILAQY